MDKIVYYPDYTTKLTKSQINFRTLVRLQRGKTWYETKVDVTIRKIDTTDPTAVLTAAQSFHKTVYTHSILGRPTKTNTALYAVSDLEIDEYDRVLSLLLNDTITLINCTTHETD
jgi:hypothetical protein